jgi:KDO2-lipid IV(A) lauroyltransferase
MLPLSWARTLGKFIAAVLFRIDTEAVRVTRATLESCFPGLSHEHQERLAKNSLEHTAMLAMESGMLWHWSPERCARLWESIAGAEIIESALERGRGVLVLVPHFGNWEVLSLYLGRWGYACLYDRPRITGLEAPMLAARSRTGGTLYPLGSKGIKAVLSTLRRGGVVALLPDQVPDAQGGIYAPFYSRPALTMTLSQRLLRATGAMPVIGAAIRTGGGFSLVFEPGPAALADEDPLIAATTLNKSTEALIEKDIPQYQWEYRRFKRPPAGLAPLYGRRRSRRR